MIVLDCSAAVEIARGTERGRAFRALMLEGEPVMTSGLFRVEVRNAFWKYVHAGLLASHDAEQYVDGALALVDVFVPLCENADEAFAEAVRQDHSVYDMFYLTLVRRSNGTLLSADRRLIALCEDMRLNCVAEAEL